MILAVELKVTNDEKTAPPVPGTEVSFINNTLSSLIRNFRLSFNNQVVSEISDYAIVSMVANRLNLNNDDFSSYLQVGNFFRDLPGQFDKAGKENTGWELRRMPFGIFFFLYYQVYFTFFFSGRNVRQGYTRPDEKEVQICQ